MNVATPRRRKYVVRLDAAGYTHVDLDVASFAVKSYDGTAGQVVLATRHDGRDEHAIELSPGQTETIGPLGHTQWFIVNRSAQAGKTLEIIIGGPGVTAGTPGYALTYGAANAENQVTANTWLGYIEAHTENLALALADNFAAIATGQKEVGTSEVQLDAQAVADGLHLVVKACVDNSGKVYVGATGLSTTTGFELSAGESISLRVTNANKLYAIASAAAQRVAWIVEKAA